MTQPKMTRSLEIDPAEIGRVKKLIPALANDPLIRAAGKVTSARVLRLALAEGLAVLEKRCDVSPEQSAPEIDESLDGPEEEDHFDAADRMLAEAQTGAANE